MRLHANEPDVKRHPEYRAAKSGNISAADLLVADMASFDCIEQIGREIEGKRVQLVAVHALETEGVNEIPAALAKRLKATLGMATNETIVQTNTVGHTGASGFHRLANQALFTGTVEPSASFLIVDDFVGQGGTLANLVGYIRAQGSGVIGATALTGKPYSAKLAPEHSAIAALRQKHGRELENWWKERFGFSFDCLTRSEARYLEHSPDAHTIRDRLAAAGLEGSAEGSSTSF
ncbi:MAG: phosphoribosyltransferase [Steroidobacteraceae bacterium]